MLGLCGIVGIQASFPQHGIVRLQEGGAALVFPFLRATWELRQHNEEASRGRKIKVRDVRAVGYFQHQWSRVLFVLNKISVLENTLRGYDRSFEWIAAHQELPCWLDLFFVYSRMLADALTVSLGRLLSEAPNSFPRDAKHLFRDHSWLPKCKLRCDNDALLTAVRQHGEWFDQISPTIGKGIRDSLVHRLCKWRVVFALGNDDLPTAIQAELEGLSADLAPDEGIALIGTIMTGMCSFLSALPAETWLNRQFIGHDLMTSASGRGLGARFLPALPIAI